MHTRREFIRLATQMSGALGVMGAIPESIQRALAIEPEPGSTVLDAEHVVILMQENRSFDHTYGTLRGVRGFDDPRAITLPDGSPVWAQANSAGERYLPFRLNIKDTKSTWMGSLPHGWTDQTDARNQGRYDRWLTAKRPGREYAGMPLTLGHYTRADIPYYYALADAFTVCDQHFCSSLTGTTPNRLYLWTGTIRAEQHANSPAHVRNEECDLDHMTSWKTFPERLEDHGISWKIYQNELTVESGLNEDEDNWLANFGDNPIEYFTQFNVRLAAIHRTFLERRVREIPGEIEALEKKRGTAPDADKQIAKLKASLKSYQKQHAEWTQVKFDKLSPREKSLHARAFATNTADPAYRQLAEVVYKDGDEQRRVKVPKGDLFHQLRKDVNDGTLPTVSWIVAPQQFSDHPSAAWYGSWYLAEVMDILTRNPKVWKKTVFMLTYDENDGYFDHVPPFVAPHPRRPETGLVSKGIDTAVEFVELEQDLKRKSRPQAREGPIGLGYRVPLVIASPWSRGGCVCSQVFDHTSPLQFLEKLLSHKTGKKIEESNISRWRRAVCGDLLSSFQANPDDKGEPLSFMPREAFVEEIHRAKFKKLPSGFHKLTNEEVEQLRRDPRASPHLVHQEPGQRRSSPLPYELAVDGFLNEGRASYAIRFNVDKLVFGERSAGAPFTVYAFAKPGVQVRNYALDAGERLEDSWPLADFEAGRYDLRVYGPNGFFRHFTGGADDPSVDVRMEYVRSSADARVLTGSVAIDAVCPSNEKNLTAELRDHAYKTPDQSRLLVSGGRATLTVDTKLSHGWYDFSVRIAGQPRFEKRYAGRVETGHWSFSDPLIGRK